MDRPSAILLLGPTGAGKTPLGDCLAERGLWSRRCHHFDFGCCLRRIAATDEPPAGLATEDVQLVRAVLEAGTLLENEQSHIAAKTLRAFLAECDAGCDDLVVMNGLPRHVGQARLVGPIVQMCAVVSLSCPAGVAGERIRANAGGDRAGRVDDDGAAVHGKLETFERRIAPLAEYYRARGVRVHNVAVGAATTPEQTWRVLEARGERHATC